MSYPVMARNKLSGDIEEFWKEGNSDEFFAVLKLRKDQGFMAFCE